MIKVGIIGYGVIGRRVADAVSAQPDMELVGIAKTKPDYKAKIAVSKNYSIYSSDNESKKIFINSGYNISGNTNDLVEKSDVIVDACPGDIGANNKEVYKKYHKKIIYQGGESENIAETSFVAQCNYEHAAQKKSVRVVSCNTTGLCRILHALDSNFGVQKSRVWIARRANDPDEHKKGIIDAVSLDPIKIPSHHGPDVNTVLPNLNIITMAIKIPTTHFHLHSLNISLKDNKVSVDNVIDVLKNTTRIILVSSKNGFKSTSQLLDYSRELGRWRSDLYELAVWLDSINIIDEELYLYMAVGQEAIVIPENIDAIRAITGGYTKSESINLTNKTLKILQ